METLLSPKDKLPYLQHPLIRGIFPTDKLHQLEVGHYPAGQTLFLQGEPLEHLLFFLKGKVKIVRRLFNGKEHILGIHEQAMIIGGIELLTNQPLVSSVVTMEDSWVVRLPLRQSRDQLLADPHFLYQIGQTLATSLYQQNIQTATQVAYTVKERLATHILAIEQEGVFQLELPILADSFGTSYRHLLRTIKACLDAGWIDKQGRSYQIVNRLELERLAIQQ